MSAGCGACASLGRHGLPTAKGVAGLGATTLGVPWERILGLGPKGLDDDRSALAEHLDLEEGDPALERLSHGSWELVPFDLLLAVAEEMKATYPGISEHIRRGHGIAAAAASDEGKAGVSSSMTCATLPPRLFRPGPLGLGEPCASSGLSGEGH